MARQPLVSVITPTWGRHEVLLDRCIPSAAAQTYDQIEHVVVSDGPDPALAALMHALAPDRMAFIRSHLGLPVIFDQLDEHDPGVRWGVRARLAGIALAGGDLICYLDDDNTFRPNHVTQLVQALEEHPEAGFAYSQILIGGSGIGSDPPVLGGIDTSAIMHRREILEQATWRDQGQQTIDWDLAERWMAAGIQWVRVNEVTADYYRTPPPGIEGIRVVSYTVSATGHCDSEDQERALADQIRAVLSAPESGCVASQFGGQYVNGPVHQPVAAAKTPRAKAK